MTKLYTLDRVVRLVIGVVIFIGVFLLVKKISSVLLPFLIGWLIAYLMHPIVMFVQLNMRVKNWVFFLFLLLPPHLRSPQTLTLLPYTTLFRSGLHNKKSPRTSPRQQREPQVAVNQDEG